jgi:hypothetical protein
MAFLSDAEAAVLWQGASSPQQAMVSAAFSSQASRRLRVPDETAASF